MPATSEDIAASDLRALKQISDQIRSNQTAMEFKHSPGGPQFHFGCPQYGPVSYSIQHLRPSFPGAESPAILPAIDLYLHILGYALPIFHTLIHREPTLHPREDSSKPRVWLYPEPLMTLSVAQKVHTWTYLDRIGESIEWVVGKECTDGPEMPDGRTTRRGDLPPMLDAGLLGYRSTIMTAPRLIDPVEDARRADKFEDEKWHQFRLATLWLHEMSHAVQNAVLPCQMGIGRQHIFLGPDSRTSELGFEVESKVFGGLLRRSFDAEATLREWPDPERLQLYQGKIETRGPTECLTRDWLVLWLVERTHWERTFDKSFWAEDLMMGNSTALQLDRAVGISYVFATRGNLSEREIPTSEKELEGYERRSENVYVRKNLGCKRWIEFLERMGLQD
ncbi:unnamed protein product [Zymoseptoria tritici ST99CH_1E4]|uniref:Uncharacterized protein n=1 Tax=Zymoseptoria tritici ST99CH_1E4 TaxID=1276532 RepID=A0A2H1FPE3_ZYMTR|nr:unnamed protein product [Zymoseptoria tritici ST99CH_1E4]